MKVHMEYYRNKVKSYGQIVGQTQEESTQIMNKFTKYNAKFERWKKRYIIRKQQEELLQDKHAMLPPQQHQQQLDHLKRLSSKPEESSKKSATKEQPSISSAQKQSKPALQSYYPINSNVTEQQSSIFPLSLELQKRSLYPR